MDYFANVFNGSVSDLSERNQDYITQAVTSCQPEGKRNRRPIAVSEINSLPTSLSSQRLQRRQRQTPRKLVKQNPLRLIP